MRSSASHASPLERRPEGSRSNAPRGTMSLDGLCLGCLDPKPAKRKLCNIGCRMRASWFRGVRRYAP